MHPLVNTNARLITLTQPTHQTISLEAYAERWVTHKPPLPPPSSVLVILRQGIDLSYTMGRAQHKHLYCWQIETPGRNICEALGLWQPRRAKRMINNGFTNMARRGWGRSMFMGLHLECYENESHIVASTLEPLTRPTFSSCQIMECIYDFSFSCCTWW